jgi:hypothetical protein
MYTNNLKYINKNKNLRIGELRPGRLCVCAYPTFQGCFLMFILFMILEKGEPRPGRRLQKKKENIINKTNAKKILSIKQMQRKYYQ